MAIVIIRCHPSGEARSSIHFHFKKMVKRVDIFTSNIFKKNTFFEILPNNIEYSSFCFGCFFFSQSTGLVRVIKNIVKKVMQDIFRGRHLPFSVVDR